jgi:hypothetical protein
LAHGVKARKSKDSDHIKKKIIKQENPTTVILSKKYVAKFLLLHKPCTTTGFMLHLLHFFPIETDKTLKDGK